LGWHEGASCPSIYRQVEGI
jgi:hypothetical protein